eukprot:gnl/MRDRNA2_/MRDRNA2_28031_c0_seq2.p1 gnl/MRDRNA2_/MRDRNA2_28031_c0~~gnl/MRDRNA2_/MRDRNA2_28031_c0_seq2.p1  ORF type:complete len:382 (+),score=64.17 gnl/MRDRNA2_/MRDRNA2_28031_c0_seq2:149-1294(+)
MHISLFFGCCCILSRGAVWQEQEEKSGKKQRKATALEREGDEWASKANKIGRWIKLSRRPFFGRQRVATASSLIKILAVKFGKRKTALEAESMANATREVAHVMKGRMAKIWQKISETWDSAAQSIGKGETSPVTVAGAARAIAAAAKATADGAAAQGAARRKGSKGLNASATAWWLAAGQWNQLVEKLEEVLTEGGLQSKVKRQRKAVVNETWDPEIVCLHLPNEGLHAKSEETRLSSRITELHPSLFSQTFPQVMSIPTAMLIGLLAGGGVIIATAPVPGSVRIGRCCTPETRKGNQNAQSIWKMEKESVQDEALIDMTKIVEATVASSDKNEHLIGFHEETNILICMSCLHRGRCGETSYGSPIGLLDWNSWLTIKQS